MISLSFTRTIGIITNIVFLLLISNGVGFELRTCCEKGKFLRHRMTCSKGDMSLSCGGSLALYKKEEFFSKFKIVERNETEFLQDQTTGYVIPEDRVCTQLEMKQIAKNGTSIGLHEIIVEYILCESNYDHSETIRITDFAAIISIISSILLAITAFIYFTIPQTQDIEGKCIFHSALTLGFCHFWFALKYWVNDIGLFSNLCITELYVLVYAVLSSFSWSSVLSYHTWSQFRPQVRLDQSKLMLRYQLFGYGFPGLLILLAYLHTHAISLYYYSSWQWYCQEHRGVLIFFYALLPWIIIELANVIFFINLQRLLWNVHPSSSQERSVSLIKKVQFKLMMNLRLFIIMGSPWWIIVFCVILGIFCHMSYAFDLAVYIFLVVCSEGILIFGIMVVGRKRVRQGIVDKFGIMKCKPSSDMETSLESSIGAKTDDGQELQIRQIEN